MTLLEAITCPICNEESLQLILPVEDSYGLMIEEDDDKKEKLIKFFREGTNKESPEEEYLFCTSCFTSIRRDEEETNNKERWEIIDEGVFE
jgi:uncharacterized protein YbaR (Trm112 family)